MTKDEALKMAIEAMETADAIVWEFGGVAYEKLQEALKICKEALEPEPMTTTDVITCKMAGKCCMTGEALEQPAWQGLTDNEKLSSIRKWAENNTMRGQELIGLCDSIEQALKEKNGKM
jgi:hypothetical protein